MDYRINITTLAKRANFKQIKVRKHTWGIDGYAIIKKIILKNNEDEFGKTFGIVHWNNGSFEPYGRINADGVFSWDLIEVLEEDMEVEIIN
jgi:hypothetical protein